ncbi:hypothetical protein ACSYGO_42130 [Streptomyces krungchingensis]
MNIRRAACATLLVAATTTACAGTGSDDGQQPTTAAKAGGTPTASATAKGSALRLGSDHHWSDTDLDGSHISGTTTVVGYTQPAEGVHLGDEVSHFPHPVWAVLDVKVCADEDSTNVLVAQQPWQLGFPDGTRVAAPLISGAGVPGPEYPVDGDLVRPGTCLRGKITFSVEKGTRPDRIVYGPEGRDPVQWAVPEPRK